jgi:hypothetical protein
MARGWESKSVEAQQADAVQQPDSSRRRLSAQEVVLFHERETLLLQRKQLVQQLSQASNPRHRASLEAGLLHLDEQLGKLNRGLPTDV